MRRPAPAAAARCRDRLASPTATARRSPTATSHRTRTPRAPAQAPSGSYAAERPAVCPGQPTAGRRSAITTSTKRCRGATEAPMASAELRAAVQRIRDRRHQPAAAQAAEQRPRAAAAAAAAAVVDVAVTPVDAGGVRGEWVLAARADADRRVLYLHGGGYTGGSATSHRQLVARISAASGCAMLSLDYRLAPAAPFPAAVDDAVAALRWMHEQGPRGPAPASATFLAGDSAGGGLALAVLFQARDRGLPMPRAAVTLSAWTDLAGTGASLHTRAQADPMVNGRALGATALAYLGSADARDPLASPLYGDFRELPPLLLQVGDAEVLLDDTLRVAERARTAGVRVTVEVEPEAPHVYQLAAAEAPEAQAAVRRIGAFLQQH
ncbi:MAG: alpha/beta hydrolase [Dehalococcoidia bacterium]|nr:alpha/beta hydrolase [Dehalococcoidia bacterium]